jgi:protein-disulfide isomerase
MVRTASSRLRLAAVGLAAVLLVAVLVAVSQSGSSGGGGAPNPGRFRGIPQHGLVLGNPDAPLTMVEFADLQCPFCAQYDRDVLLTIVKRYVRTGKLRLELRLLTFIGPDSVRMARVAEAAAGQERAWPLVDLIYHNQGEENSGYATTAYLRKLMAQVPGLDGGQALGDSSSAAVAAPLRDAQTAAHRAGIDSTPSFLIGPTGGRLAPLSPSALEPSAFTGPIDKLLR